MPAAIVTGSDSGIGKAIAVRLAEAGYDIGITWHEDEKARPTRRGRSGQLDGVRPFDDSTGAAPEAVDAIDELMTALEGVDVLVNNAARHAGRRSSSSPTRIGSTRSTST